MPMPLLVIHLFCHCLLIAVDVAAVVYTLSFLADFLARLSVPPSQLANGS